MAIRPLANYWAWHVSIDPTFLLLPPGPSSQYSPQSDRTWRLNDPGQRTCEQRLYRAALSWLTVNLSLYLESAALHFNFGPHR